MTNITATCHEVVCAICINLLKNKQTDAQFSVSPLGAIYLNHTHIHREQNKYKIIFQQLALGVSWHADMFYLLSFWETCCWDLCPNPSAVELNSILFVMLTALKNYIWKAQQQKECLDDPPDLIQSNTKFPTIKIMQLLHSESDRPNLICTSRCSFRLFFVLEHSMRPMCDRKGQTVFTERDITHMARPFITFFL